MENHYGDKIEVFNLKNTNEGWYRFGEYEYFFKDLKKDEPILLVYDPETKIIEPNGYSIRRSVKF